MIKLFLSNLVMPFNFLLFTLFLTHIVKHRMFRHVSLLALCTLTILSTRVAALLCVYPLERYSYHLHQNHKDRLAENIDAIVVLGRGGVHHGTWSQPTLTLDAQQRINTGLQILQQRSETSLFIFSGGGDILGSEEVEGDITQKHLENEGFEDFIIEKTSKTTYENAINTKSLLTELKQWKEQYPIVLITSALHLPRSDLVFKAQGFKTYSMVSHYKGSSQILWTRPESYIPSPSNLNLVTEAWHEYIGLFVYWVTGKLSR